MIGAVKTKLVIEGPIITSMSGLDPHVSPTTNDGLFTRATKAVRITFQEYRVACYVDNIILLYGKYREKVFLIIV